MVLGKGLNVLQELGNSSKILVIEDEAEIRANLVDLLEIEDFEVITAENGHVGVQLAQAHLPNLILCDVMMPDLDGYGVLRCLQQIPETVGIPLIFLTAKASKTDFRQGMTLGADDYLTKPFTREELLAAIDTQLNKRAALTQPYTQALQKVTERLEDHLYYDDVTHLPNRLLLQERFNQIRETHGDQQQIPILSVSLDRFRQLCNSLIGFDSDTVLRDAAQRLSNCVNSQDTVARLDGEQFALILAEAESSSIEQICQQILTTFSQPFQLESQEFFLSVSLGVAFYPRDGSELNNLMQKASIALQHIQKRGGNQHQFYTANLRIDNPDKLALEASLRRALERNEFCVYYQPQVDLQTGKVVGAEALIRWQNPERGMVSPGVFIPLAEETGLIQEIGDWVLYAACQQTNLWQQTGFSALRIAVNLSARQFSQLGLSQQITNILESTGLAPACLELEVTESALLQNASAAIATLTELKELGVHIAIDDFGTGYASLSYLKQFPFDVLKIDRCFVQNLPEDKSNTAIVSAIIQMAHNLDLQVIAEGVETESELAFLQHHHCNSIQGFLFSCPLPTTEFEFLLTSAKSLTLQTS